MRTTKYLAPMICTSMPLLYYISFIKLNLFRLHYEDQCFPKCYLFCIKVVGSCEYNITTATTVRVRSYMHIWQYSCLISHITKIHQVYQFLNPSTTFNPLPTCSCSLHSTDQCALMSSVHFFF